MKIPSDKNRAVLIKGVEIGLPALVVTDLLLTASVYAITNGDNWWWFKTLVAFPYFALAAIAAYILWIVVAGVAGLWD